MTEVKQAIDSDDSLSCLFKWSLTSFLNSSVTKIKIIGILDDDKTLSKANFDNFTQEELIILGEVSKSNKLKKNIKSNEIQIDILNLENKKLPVSKLLDVYRTELNIKLDSNLCTIVEALYP